MGNSVERDPLQKAQVLSYQDSAGSSDSECELSNSSDSGFSVISESVPNIGTDDGQSPAAGDNSDLIEDTVVGSTIEESELSIPPNITIPQSLTQLQDKLRNGYSPPPVPPSSARLETQLNDLSKVNLLSLQHYIAWSESNGTVKAYKKHAQVLE
jgi:hypothetical protein